MPTFLVTKKMSPELAARVASSVTGRHVRPGHSRLGPRMIALMRVLIVGTVVALVWAFVSARRRDSQHFDQARNDLVASLRVQSDKLTPADKTSLIRDEAFLHGFATKLDPDISAPSLETTLSRSAMYVRGSLDAFTHKDTIAGAAVTSVKDAFLVCLLSPPQKTERAMITKLLDAYGSMEAHTKNVRRLGDAEVGLSFLLPAYADKVRGSISEGELGIYQKEVSKISLDHVVSALKAEILIAVMDDAGSGVTEMDGEKPHDIRVAIVERASQTVLFRTRKHVDPSHWSDANRPQYAGPLDSCGLAIDLRSVPVN